MLSSDKIETTNPGALDLRIIRGYGPQAYRPELVAGVVRVVVNDDGDLLLYRADDVLMRMLASGSWLEWGWVGSNGAG